MEQRTVIISAIVLAFILTGVLWYTLVTQDSQTTDNVALESPTPTITSELRPTESPTPMPAIAGITDQATPTPTPATVAASAKTGTTEWLIFALLGSVGVGAWGLNRSRQLF